MPAKDTRTTVSKVIFIKCFRQPTDIGALCQRRHLLTYIFLQKPTRTSLLTVTTHKVNKFTKVNVNITYKYICILPVVFALEANALNFSMPLSSHIDDTINLALSAQALNRVGNTWKSTTGVTFVVGIFLVFIIVVLYIIYMFIQQYFYIPTLCGQS